MLLSSQEINRILIVKTSSLGDVIQALGTLDYLHARYPHAKIDWVVEEGAKSLLESHPLIHRVISCDTKSWKRGLFKVSSWRKVVDFLRSLRKYRYDTLFDLQGNTKSALWTFLAKSKDKVGFGLKSVREWPNLLSTKVRWDAATGTNVRLQHIGLMQDYFKDKSLWKPQKLQLEIADDEKEKLKRILSHPFLVGKKKVMVCPGSKWKNKQLSAQEWKKLLELLASKYDFSFLLLWGNPLEKEFCESLMVNLSRRCVLVDVLPLPTWQNLISNMDLLLAIDSSALHFSGTADIPSFSFFGPTTPQVFKPIGPKHHAIQGKCPYGQVFPKQCPLLRTCKTGACIKNLKADQLFSTFSSWWDNLAQR